MNADLLKLETVIAYRFHNHHLFEQALTHRSASTWHMERLEFLGDAVLGVVIAAELYDRFPRASEGDLSRMRAVLVCRDGLLNVARAWELSSFLRVGAGERRQGGGLKSASIAANAVEALVGAVFLDGGWEEGRRIVLGAWEAMLDQVASADTLDAKTRLQEYTQAQGLGLPKYIVRDHGRECPLRFEAECHISGKLAGRGAGERKKIAEMKAAEQAWECLKAKNSES